MSIKHRRKGGRRFLQLFTNVKQSAAYHGLSLAARAALDGMSAQLGAAGVDLGEMEEAPVEEAIAEEGEAAPTEEAPAEEAAES